jgi:hypothetical protein
LTVEGLLTSEGQCSLAIDKVGFLYLLMKICRKVKVTVKYTLEKAAKAQKGSRGIALLFL